MKARALSVALAAVVTLLDAAAYAAPADPDSSALQPASASPPSTASAPVPALPPPFVKGGIYDRPFITRAGPGARFGGYAEAAYRFERADGFTEEQTFSVDRVNLFAFAPVSDRVRLASEIEFEDAGEEVKIELAIIDLEIHRAATFRAGILLSPLGRFNVAHDSPANELIDRPLVSTEIIPTTLSEPGMGFYGALHPGSRARVTYEAYAVNGFDEGVLSGSTDGTRISAGKSNFEDDNARPSFVGRVAVSPVPAFEAGVSMHAGPYNVWESEGLALDERRDVAIWALDADAAWGRLGLQGEYAHAVIDLPAELGGLQAGEQQGVFLQAKVRVFDGALAAFPASWFTGVARFDAVDWDADLDGDSQIRTTFGVNFRPTGDTAFKLDYQYNWLRDRFDTPAHAAGLAFGVATYF